MSRDRPDRPGRARSAALPAHWRYARLLFAAALAALLILVTQGTAYALVQSMDVEQLTDAASTIAVVTPLKATSILPTGKGLATDRVYTKVTTLVSKVLKGDSGAAATLRLPGGSVGGLTVTYEDAPVFVSGVRYAVFLDRLGRVVGGYQGAVHLDSTGAASAAQPAQTGSALLDRVARRVAGKPSGAVATAPALGLTTATPKSVRVLSNLEPPQLVAGVLPAAVPAIGSVSPATASAGTGTAVTINGSGFGSTAGTVQFFYKAVSGVVTPIAGSVVSWSDTQVVVIVPTGSISGYPASAGSGPMYVRLPDGTTSATYDGFSVSFGYSGYRWSALSRTFRVNPNTADVPADTIVDLVRAGGEAWDGLSLFSFVYGGTCSITGYTQDSYSDVFWGTLATGILAQARLTYSGGYLIDADIQFNDYYRWGDGSTGTYDIQSIASHELGHWLGLRDLYASRDSAKFMYGYGSTGTTKRVPAEGDAAGIAWIYGAPAPITVAEPSFAPEGGTYTGSVDVAMSCNTSGATIRYTTDGSDPTELSPAYSGSIPVTTTTTLKARAFKTDWTPSPAHIGTYTIEVPPAPPEPPTLSRLAGTDRYLTAVEVSERAFPSGARAVVLATGGDFPDALAAPPLAKALGGPVLLVKPTGLTPEVLAELARLSPRSVVICGGTGAVSKTVYDQVASLLHLSPKRLGGANRYGTAALIADELVRQLGPRSKVVLVTASRFSDAVAAGPLASAKGWPILLCAAKSIPTETRNELNKLKPVGIWVVRTGTAIPDAVVASLSGVTDLKGTDAYDTCGKACDEGAAQGLSWSYLMIASGEKFPDALGAVSAVAEHGGTLLFTRYASLPAASSDRIQANLAKIVTVEIAGGTAAVSDSAYTGIATALGLP